MKGFRSLSQFFMLCALGLTLFDLVHEWIGYARFKIRTVEEVWLSFSDVGEKKGAQIIQTLFSYHIWKVISATPAPLALLVLALFCYLVSRLLFLIEGKGRAARL